MALFNGLIAVQLLGHSSDGQATSNTFHLSNPSAGSPPDFDELTGVANDLDTWLTTQYRAIAVTTWTFDSIVCRNVTDPANPVVTQEAQKSIGSAGTKNVSGSAVPQALSPLLFFQTPNASRRFRGHLFLPPIVNAADVSGNVLNTGTAYYTTLQAFRDKLRAGIATSRTWTGSHLSNYNLVLYSKVAAQQGLASVANVQTVGIRNPVAFLRSRQKGTT